MMVTSDSGYSTAHDVITQLPFRREQDRIVLIETHLRSVLLSGHLPDAPNQAPLTLPKVLELVANELTRGMGEALVEIWLRALPPWITLAVEDSQPLRAGASATPTSVTDIIRLQRPADDILLAVVTAGRPLRFDDAEEHPLVRQWAANAGIAPEKVMAFLGIPIRAQGELLGVLAVGSPGDLTSEHATLIDAIAHYIGAGVEMTRLRAGLHSQQELAQTVLSEAPVAAAVMRVADDTIVMTNRRFDTLLQIGPDVWGQQLSAVLPDHAPQLRTALHLDAVAQNGETRVIFDLPIRLATGITYWDFTCSPLRDTTGTLENILIAGVDVTARVTQRQRQKRSVDIAQERLYQMVELHRIALEVASQLGQDLPGLLRQILEKMVQLVNAQGGMVYYADRERGELEVVVSTGLEQDYTGMRLARGEGLAGKVFVTGESQRVDDYRTYPLRASSFADAPIGAMAAIPMKQRGQVIGVICLVHRLPTEVPSTPERFPDEAATHLFTSDDMWVLELFATQAGQAIENARTYRDLERAYQQQRALDRQKDDFIARASHDLRLPLTSVIGFVELSLDLLNDSTQVNARSMLEQAASEAQRLKELMDQLLAQVQLDSGERNVHVRAVRLAPIIEEVVQARRKQALLHGAPHSFAVQVPEDLMVATDVARLKEILENLLSNAAKYSPQGGLICVAAAALPTSSPQMVELTVSDQGIGIPREAHDQIFERFTRVESPLVSEIRGNGLGLYLARQLTESLNGRLWLKRSFPGEGSTFALTLPQATADE